MCYNNIVHFFIGRIRDRIKKVDKTVFCNCFVTQKTPQNYTLL